MAVEGVLLAAGAGRRYGGPKVLADAGAWLATAVAALRTGGCDGVTVVLGAGAGQAAPLVAATGARVALADDWASGMSASLRAGLRVIEAEAATAALVHLVDLPDVTAAVVRRVLAEPFGAATLRRASYAGTPGHPVLIGREHWAPLDGELSGDAGARGYLARHRVELVECADLASGHDVDEPRDGPTSGQPVDG